jgi:cytochrome P450
MDAVAAGIPSHVDPSRVRPFDLYKTGAKDGDYHTWWREKFQCSGGPDIFWTQENGGHWVATRSEDFVHFLENPELYSSEVNVVPRDRNFGLKLNPINLDPPDHTKYRNLFTNVFAPKNVIPLGESARQLTIDLVEGFYKKGGCEFMSEFAYHLPIAIFLNLVGVPDSERLRLLDIVEKVVRPDEPGDMKPFQALFEFAAETVAARRAKPGSDLVSMLTQVQVEGRGLEDHELVGMMLLLLIGGLDTVASSLGFVMRHIARNPEMRSKLIEIVQTNPAAAQGAIEELFRRFPVTTLVRLVTKDHEYKGIQFKAGDLVANYSGAQTLDDRVFPNPMALDLLRKAGFHGGFGAGPHRCLGSMLARVEMKAFLEEWFKRIPNFEVAPGVELKVRPGLVVAMEELPLRWTVK